MRSRTLLAIGMLAVGAAAAPAQQPARNGHAPFVPDKHGATESRYVPFPFERDVEGRLKEQLATMQELQKYNELLARLMRDHKKFQLDPEQLKQLNFKDPKVQKTLQQFVQQSKGNAPSPPDWEKLQADLKQLAKDPPVVERGPGGAASELPLPAAKDGEATARDWLKDFMERAEESKFGEWLRESPAWQKAITDLKWSPRLPAPRAERWGQWFGRRFTLDRLPTPDAKALERLGRLKPPDLSRWAPSLPSLPRPSLPSVSAPALPSAANFGTLATWLLVLGALVVVAWQASRWLRQDKGNERSAGLGPWPVNPATVATRAELVEAFDYLAILVLGSPARSWHHRAIARALAERDASLAGTADQLAVLYEQARYTDGADELPTAERDDARVALTRFAEAASP
jgi:hypothetical protein